MPRNLTISYQAHFHCLSWNLLGRSAVSARALASVLQLVQFQGQPTVILEAPGSVAQ